MDFSAITVLDVHPRALEAHSVAWKAQPRALDTQLIALESLDHWGLNPDEWKPTLSHGALP
jgi:hypothetical protein